MSEYHFDICLRVVGVDAGSEGIGRQRCPACDSAMAIHQPDGENPLRLLANCACEACGIWFAVIVRPDERVAYLVRLPSVVELVEAIDRRGDDRPPCTGHR